MVMKSTMWMTRRSTPEMRPIHEPEPTKKGTTRAMVHGSTKTKVLAPRIWKSDSVKLRNVAKYGNLAPRTKKVTSVTVAWQLAS